MLSTTSHVFRQVISRHVNRSVGRTRLPQLIRTMASGAKPADKPPVETHRISRNGEEFTEIKEGLGRILIPSSAKNGTEDTKSEEDHQKVFYNPIQQFNRDLTVLAIKAYGEEIVEKRRASAEKRINKKKRKRSDVDGSNPHTSESAAPHDVAQEQSTAQNGETMDVDVSEPADSNQPIAEVEQGTQLAEPKEEPRQRKLDPPKFTILDALSATGLRALRYVQELPFVTSVTANDLTADAVEAIKRNAEHNGVETRVNATQGDARAHMYSLIAQETTLEHERNPRGFRKGPNSPSGKYDVIDLDPYGTAATFFDAAVHAVRDDGGLLCITCTDSGVWASHGYPEKAFALYGGIPVKGSYSHEVGLRLVLNGLATTAARHGLAIEPLLSLSIDYYLRVFVRIRKSPASVKFLAGKTMIAYSCDQGCGAWETQLLARNRKVSNNKGSGVFYKHGLAQAPTADQYCKHCGTKTHLAGPMYAGPLHSAEFIQRILADLPNASKEIYGTTARIEGMLQTALEEALPPPPDSHPSSKDDEFAAAEPYPFYFHLTSLSGSIHCSCPDEDSFRGALRGLGYEVTRSHCKPGSIKTNAPWSIVWHIMREWIRQKAPIKEENIKEGSAAFRLLRLDQKKEGEVQNGGKNSDDMENVKVVFDQALGRDKSARKGLVRYQMNPRENWGPLSRARGH
ncbi:S-adenosyl-L-methionine-dependent methyltransferase [Xylariales sp. PMI_506]|nr:S-adenosyl-L-methionine-dependent methyltransferase [Xylariales sp. PMI_506]